MNLRKTVINTVSTIALFIAFLYPAGRLVFTDAGTAVVRSMTSRLGLYEHQEPGDSFVDATFLLSLLSAVLVVWIVNRIVKQRNRNHTHVK